MSFPPYSHYAASAVDWIGAIPAHWKVSKFRHLFRESSEKIEGVVVGPMLSVSGYRGIEIKEYDDENRRRLDEDLQGYRVVRVGQLVVNTMWLNYAGLGVSDFEGHVSPAYRSYSIDTCLDRRFVHHLMRSSIYVQGYTQLLTGIRPNSLQLGRNDLMEFPVLVPPKEEQNCIARFLDRETAKIDALVEKQRRLIELLQEKRQAVISHAVTKGLNPDVRMKPSGVEWLGEIPEHWIITPLKWLTDPDRPIMYGIVLPGPDVGDGIPILKGGNVKPSRMNLPSMARTTPEIEAPYARARLQQGDLVYSIRGSIGDCEIVPAELEGSNITQDVARVAIRSGVSAAWTRWALLASQIREDLASGSLGAAVRGINIFDLKRVLIPTPPFDEQVAIAAHIDAQVGDLERLETVAEQTVDLLQERRSAIISAAVTGKFDVRGLVPSERKHEEVAAA